MKHLLAATLVALTAIGVAAQTPAPAAPPLRLRGTVEAANAATLTLKERSGETIVLDLPAGVPVNEVLPIELSAIRPGAFVGTAAMPQPDGTQRALEVLVFPEEARGTGEGHYPWDLQPGSTMTNATVADLTQAPQGRRMTLTYKDGAKTVVVPEGVPVVTFKPGDRTLLVPGAKVVVIAQARDGRPTVVRVLAGRNGFAPPM